MRMARLHVPGVVHHLIWRFVDSRWFLDGVHARPTYLRLLGRALEDSDWKCVAYALMSNHIHLAAVAGRSPLAEWSRCVNLPFASWVNEQHGRIGPVFANRARDHAVGPAGAPAVIGYIHNNPVRASVVARAADSEWTSHRAYIGTAPAQRWLDVSLGLELSQMRPAEFDGFVDGQPAEPERPRVDKIARKAKEYGQVNTATPFERQVPLVIRPFARISPDPRRVVELTSAAFALDAHLVASRRRRRDLYEARVAAIHVGIAIGLTGADMGSSLNVSQQTVSRIVRHEKRPVGVCELVYAQLMRELTPG